MFLFYRRHRLLYVITLITDKINQMITISERTRYIKYKSTGTGKSGAM